MYTKKDYYLSLNDSPYKIVDKIYGPYGQILFGCANNTIGHAEHHQSLSVLLLGCM
jgi:hypothetical protein